MAKRYVEKRMKKTNINVTPLDSLQLNVPKKGKSTTDEDLGATLLMAGTLSDADSENIFNSKNVVYEDEVGDHIIKSRATAKFKDLLK